jgi:putative transposase
LEFGTPYVNFLPESEGAHLIFRAFDPVTSPVFQLVTTCDEFKHKIRRINGMWQTYSAQFKVIGWGWHYLCTVLDDFSRYILAYRLAATMVSSDVEQTLNIALERTGVTQVQVKLRPRLLSDNGHSFISKPLADYLSHYKIKQFEGCSIRPRARLNATIVP